MENPAKTKRNLRSSEKKSLAEREAASSSKKSKAKQSNNREAGDAKAKIKRFDTLEQSVVSETSEKQMRESIRHEVCPTSEAEVVQETISTETVAVLDKGSVSTEKLSKKKRKVKRVRYEVNCGDITDLDMIEFQTFMRSEVKVAGAKNSPYLKVSLQGKKIIFKSKRFVAKKSVRFSARKYFKNKKNRSVCVVNESRNSYKLTVKL